MFTVGSRLKEEMARLHYDSLEFSKIAGVTARAQYNYECDIRKPKTEYWEAVAKIGIDVQYIITGVRSISIDRRLKAVAELLEGLNEQQRGEILSVVSEKKRMNELVKEVGDLKKRVG